jgi:hypothetical protein
MAKPLAFCRRPENAAVGGKRERGGQKPKKIEQCQNGN